MAQNAEWPYQWWHAEPPGPVASQEIDGDEDKDDYDVTGGSRLVLVGEQKRKRKRAKVLPDSEDDDSS